MDDLQENEKFYNSCRDNSCRDRWIVNFVVASVVRLTMMSTLQRLHDLRTGDGINSGGWGECILQYFVLGYIRWDIPSIFNLCSLSFIWL